MILGHSNPLLAHYGQWMRKNHPEKLQFFRTDRMERLESGCPVGVYRTQIPEEVHSSAYVGERCCDFLRHMAADRRPFYCFASFPDPHWPIMTPPAYYDMYRGVEMPQDAYDTAEYEKPNYPPPFRRALEGRHTCYEGGGMLHGPQTDMDAIRRAYWGAVTLVDKYVGRILDCLAQCGLAEDTVVVFTTDHGEYMGSHGMLTKGGFLWDDYIRVPFLLRFPGRVPARRSDALFSFVDIVPTLLELCGLDPALLPADGVSQAALFRGGTRGLRDCLTVTHTSNREQAPNQHCIVTADGWKLVYFAGESGGLLYDLTGDPGELRNLYGLPSLREKQAALTGLLLDRLILERDKAPLRYGQTADRYGQHEMVYEKWRPEFDAAERLAKIDPS